MNEKKTDYSLINYDAEKTFPRIQKWQVKGNNTYKIYYTRDRIKTAQKLSENYLNIRKESINRSNVEDSEFTVKTTIDSGERHYVDPDNLPNCAYFDCNIGFQTNALTKRRILIEYNGDRDFLVDHIANTYPDKLNSILQKEEYKKYGVNIKDFNLNTFKKKNGYQKDKMTKIVLDNFKDEITKLGVTNEQISISRNGGKRKDFVINVAKKHSDELKAIGLSDNDIKQMEEYGRTPNGFNVHHKFNRFHTTSMNIDYNAPENLILINCSEFDGYHQDVHKHIDAQTDKIEQKNGVRADINLVWLPGAVYNPNKKMSEQEIIEQSKKEMDAVLKRTTPEHEKTFKKIADTLSTSGEKKNTVISSDFAMKIKKSMGLTP